MKRRRVGELTLLEGVESEQYFCVGANTVILSGGEILQPGYVYFDRDGNIKTINSTPPTKEVNIPFASFIVPGHVDIHNHGVGGADDVIDYWNDPSYTLARLARVGTTSCLGTVVFPDDQRKRSKLTCQRLNAYVNQENHGCVLRGIHAEGPIVATLGGLPDSSKQVANDIADFESLLNDIGEHLKMMTISPSVEAQTNYCRMKALVQRNILVSFGHDKDCQEKHILDGIRACHPRRVHMTHCFNVQSFHHRNSGLANFALLDSFPELPIYSGLQTPTVEMIGDMKHVSPMTMQALLNARSASDVCVITDAIAEKNPGKVIKYSSDRKAQVSEDGETVNIAGTNTLCGSCTNMHDTFRKLVNIFRLSLSDAVQICSTTPCNIIGVQDHVGSIALGKRGDLLLLDSNLNLLETIIGGRSIWSINEPMLVRSNKKRREKGQ
jgi:N-acetylglucosamine-6-phosphate deacetylase